MSTKKPDNPEDFEPENEAMDDLKPEDVEVTEGPEVFTWVTFRWM